MTRPPDTVETVAGARIQHGPLSRRIYLMTLGDAKPRAVVKRLDRLARERRYTKVFAKVPVSRAAGFLAAGFAVEARVPGLYRGREAGLFLGRYYDAARRVDPRAETCAAVLRLAQQQTGRSVTVREDLRPRWCRPDDVKRMARLYAEVFPSYPFPIQDPLYLRQTMADHVRYCGVESDGRLVALASGETNRAAGNVEMTDFATAPACRGQGYAQGLLAFMDAELSRAGLTTAYTIARAGSPGMNITFARAGYRYAGRLINNTHIGGQIESMNVWYKDIAPAAPPEPSSPTD